MAKIKSGLLLITMLLSSEAWAEKGSGVPLKSILTTPQANQSLEGELKQTDQSSEEPKSIADPAPIPGPVPAPGAAPAPIAPAPSASETPSPVVPGPAKVEPAPTASAPVSAPQSITATQQDLNNDKGKMPSDLSIPASPTVSPAPAVPPTAPANDQATLKSVINTNPDKKTEMVREDKQPPEFTKSLMFRQDEIDKIRMVYNIYLERQKNKTQVRKEDDKKIDDIIGKLSLNPSTPEQSDLPAAPTGIYLNSIIYRAPGNASVWVNGVKYDNDVTKNNIRVINATSNYAEVEWRATGYKDSDINDWTAIFPRVGETPDKELPTSRRGITVSPETSSVRAVLRPNQYLDTHGKAIREGKPPVIKESKSEVSALPGASSKVDLPVKDETGSLLPLSAAINAPIDAVNNANNSLKNNSSSPDVTKGPEEKKEVEIKIMPNGHYDIPIKTNNIVINFRVDTGATYPVVSKADAERMGVDLGSLQYDYQATVANGTIVKSAKTKVPSMYIQDLEYKDVDLMVADGDFPQPLLGASFLNTIKYSMADGVMKISK